MRKLENSSTCNYLCPICRYNPCQCHIERLQDSFIIKNNLVRNLEKKNIILLKALQKIKNIIQKALKQIGES